MRDLDKETVATFISGASHPPAGISADRHNKTLHLEDTGLNGACNLEKSAEESCLCRFTKKVPHQFRIYNKMKNMNSIQEPYA